MANSMNGSSGTDAGRYQSYLSQMERQFETDVRDKEETHRDKVTRLINHQTGQQEQMRKDYDVRISDEAENLEKKLGLIRERNQILVNEERERGEREADKIRAQYQQKIDAEKVKGDEQLSRLQSYYKKASDDLNRAFEREKVKATQRANTGGRDT